MISNILREPLVQFVAIGTLVFAAYSVFEDTPPQVEPSQIVIDSGTVARLKANFKATWRRPPTAEELDRLVEGHVREKVFVREANALGLDQGDAVVRRRLRQKMEFLMQPAEETLDPDEAELKEYFETHRDRFRIPGTVGFTQVFLGPHPAEVDVATTLEQLNSGADPGLEGVRSLLRMRVPPSSLRAVDSEFGDGFYDALQAVEQGEWGGPIHSGYGIHLVRIDAHTPARLPPFEELRQEVEREWASERAKSVTEARYRSMRDRYEVVRRDLEGVQSSGVRQ